MKVRYLKVGDAINLNGEIWQILEIEHSHRGRGKADIEFLLKNIKSGNTLKKVFNPDEDLEEIELEKRPIKFLYSKHDIAYFLDEKSNKYEIKADILGNKFKFLKKDLDIKGLFYENQLLNIELPIKAVYKVIETSPGVKGDSEKSNYKIAKIETDAEITVPLFIEIGEEIVVNTEKGEYVERYKK